MNIVSNRIEEVRMIGKKNILLEYCQECNLIAKPNKTLYTIKHATFNVDDMDYIRKNISDKYELMTFSTVQNMDNNEDYVRFILLKDMEIIHIRERHILGEFYGFDIVLASDYNIFDSDNYVEVYLKDNGGD